MTAIDIVKDLVNLSLTATVELDAPVANVWAVWADPRKLEQWWGPPTYPATVPRHELTPGGTVHYFMTGPEGDRFYGLWRVLEVDAPSRLQIEDAFADEHFVADANLPTNITEVTITVLGENRTRMISHTMFPSAEAMRQTLEMGVEDGMRAAMGQIAPLLLG